jgi:hypothetical protein
MKPPTYAESLLQPLTTDALVEQRVAALVGRACRRQLWFLFLDENEVQLPLIIPVADPPAHPDGSARNLAAGIRMAMESVGAASVVVVIERFADQAVTAVDTAWARTIDDTFAEAGAPVRAFLISHRRGVRWLAADDYRFAAGESGQSR